MVMVPFDQRDAPIDVAQLEPATLRRTMSIVYEAVSDEPARKQAAKERAK